MKAAMDGSDSRGPKSETGFFTFTKPPLTRLTCAGVPSIVINTGLPLSPDPNRRADVQSSSVDENCFLRCTRCHCLAHLALATTEIVPSFRRAGYRVGSGL